MKAEEDIGLNILPNTAAKLRTLLRMSRAKRKITQNNIKDRSFDCE